MVMLLDVHYESDIKLFSVKLHEVEIENSRTRMCFLASKREKKFNLYEERNTLLKDSFVLKFNNARDFEIIYATDYIGRLHLFSVYFSFTCIFLLRNKCLGKNIEIIYMYSGGTQKSLKIIRYIHINLISHLIGRIFN